MLIRNKITVFSLLIVLVVNIQSMGQESTTISSLDVTDAIVGESINFEASLLQPEVTSNVRLAYKVFSETEFTFVDMEMIANKANYVLSGDEVQLPSIQYYLIVQLTNGTVETFPADIPELNTPLELVVAEKPQKEKEIILLSPTPGERLALEDLFISVSFVRAPDNVDVSATKITIGDTDISDLVLVAGDLILFNSANFPGTVPSGDQNLSIQVYDKEGNLYHSINSRFFASTREIIQEEAEAFTYRGNLKAESRNENFNKESLWFNNLSADLNASYSDWDFRGYAYVTSEEKTDQQPRNRFFVEAKTDWMNIRGGDSYPRFPKLIMNGKRVRGVSGDIELGFFNVKAAYGDIKRGVEGQLLNVYSAEDAPLQSNIINIDESKYGQPFGEINAGTFRRDIFALRPSFGSGENFQWGFTYFHSKDDVNSIEFGGSPRENVALGTDMRINIDNRNIIVRGSAAVTLYNDDISGGDLTDAQIDSVFGAEDSFVDVDPDIIKDIKSILGSFITVNQNIGPINPQELSSLGAEASIQLNYFNNNLKASYIYRGNEYTSFGQDFIRKDIKGFNIVDRIGVWQNRLFLTLGMERLQDNLQETKFSTTTYNTYNAAISLFPRMNIPNITVSFSRNENNNNIDIADPTLAIYFVDYSTNRISTNLSYPFETGIKHNSSLSFSTSSTEDKGINQMTADVLSTSLSLNSFWSRDLTSYFNFTFFDSDIANQQYQYFTVSLGGKYRLLQDKLELRATIKPTFGDLEQQVFDMLADYRFIDNLSLGFQFRLFRRPNISTDSIAGLTLRYNLI
jgi:hypothetical protein